MPKKPNDLPPAKNGYHIPLLVLAGLSIIVGLNIVERYESYREETRIALGKEQDDVRGVQKYLGPPISIENDDNKVDSSKNKDGEKPKTNQGSINALLHKEKIHKVVNSLQEIAEEEELVGNKDVSQDIEEVAGTEEEEVDEVSNAISKIEKRPKWKTLLLGSDYKSLGKLRSHLARNTNTIRKINKSVNSVWAQGNQEEVQAQLGELMQERERIRQVIVKHENEYGVLGWAFRYLNGYIGGNLDDSIEDLVDVP